MSNHWKVEYIFSWKFHGTWRLDNSPCKISWKKLTEKSAKNMRYMLMWLPLYKGGWLAPLPFTPESGVRFPVSAVWKKQKMFLPHPRVKVSIVGSLRDREVACSASDRQGSNFESCVWRTVSSQSSHHPQEVLLAQFSLYVHKGGLKPDSFFTSSALNVGSSWRGVIGAY